MAVSAYDVQLCLSKLLEFLSETCVTISTRYPFVPFSLFCLSLLYMCFPLVFWFLVYAFPVVVCTCIILSISFNIGNVRNHSEVRDIEESDDDGKYNSFKRKPNFSSSDDCANYDDDKRNRKPFTRVHSVRRRRARNIIRMEEDNTQQQNTVEEKKAVSSTNFNNDLVDKNTLREESPKEIREVEIDHSPAVIKSDPKKHEHDEDNHKEISLEEGLKDSKEKREDEEEEKNHHVMDVGISDSERTKRLESLIARRRSRKLLSLEVRRTLMNLDRFNERPANITSIVIPRNNNNNCSPSKVCGPFSPVPGSAPSILVPMRNPFDLPYDPYEEKPDLTGDGFQQEFLSPVNNRDTMMFCRHESFSLGVFNHNQNEETSSLVHNFGFRQRASSSSSPTPGHQFSRPTDEFGKEFGPIMEQESYQVSESKSPTGNAPDGDHIKEIIQVHENGSIHNHSEEDDNDEGQSRSITSIPKEDSSITSSSSPSSTEEDEPVFKIDKEAILKSLSSMARRNAGQEETEHNDDDQIGGDDRLNYPTSSFESSIRLKDNYYYADKSIRRHRPSYSIASDLQVEVSEVSSPPLTIDENFSYHDQDEDMSTIYDGEMEKKIYWDGEEYWASSSRPSHVDEDESRSVVSSEQDIMKVGSSRINKLDEDNTTLSANSMEGSLNEEYCIPSHSSDIEFSIGSNDYRQQSGWNLAPSQSSRGNDPGKTVDDMHQSNQSARIESRTGEQIEEQLENHETNQHREDAQSSAQASINRNMLGSNDPQGQYLMPNFGIEHSLISPKSVLLPTLSVASFDHIIDDEVQQNTEILSPNASQNAEPTDGSRSTTFNINNDVSIFNFETTDHTAFSQNTAQRDNMYSSLTIVQELPMHQEMVTREESNNHSNKLSNSKDEREEKSILHADTAMDHERETNLSTSNHLAGTEDELQKIDSDETHILFSGPLEDNGNSESGQKNKHDTRAREHASSSESIRDDLDKLETSYTFNNETK